MKVFVSYQYRFRGGSSSDSAIKRWEISEINEVSKESLKNLEAKLYKEVGGWDSGYYGVTILNISVLQ